MSKANCPRCGRVFVNVEAIGFDDARGKVLYSRHLVCSKCEKAWNKCEQKAERLAGKLSDKPPQKPCSACKGTGRIKGYRCVTCDGTGNIETSGESERSRFRRNKFNELWSKECR